MFEKEAEEYATRECCTTCKNINHFCKEKCECWIFARNGAEYGYAKALKEIADLKDCSNCKHWEYSTRSLSYYCEKTGRCADCEKQGYSCEHWEY